MQQAAKDATKYPEQPGEGGMVPCQQKAPVKTVTGIQATRASEAGEKPSKPRQREKEETERQGPPPAWTNRLLGPDHTAGHGLAVLAKRQKVHDCWIT